MQPALAIGLDGHVFHHFESLPYHALPEVPASLFRLVPSMDKVNDVPVLWCWQTTGIFTAIPLKDVLHTGISFHTCPSNSGKGIFLPLTAYCFRKNFVPD